ncbi:MAG: hypothetical protein HOJ34_11475 [Kordiimonadaceae bacterium]|nr:hypothetical protein [Kordiimonadaceae bacterium]MBT6035029.1 hypothetical protein [Kordiimonadaceae bacterium]MBT6330392.1 hypothetical protein [Kordiimonadaceae bacterium]MBT7583579.1 hypothetical protein [Kordiimonadaceae bacterium]
MAVLISGTSVTPAYAHQLRSAITKVLFNKNTGNLEVMHRFYLHDTEHAVQMLFDKKADIRNSADSQELFANYVGQRFAIKPLDGEELKLKPVGHEIERIYFWVYQEVKAPEDIKGLTMIHNALRDIWTDQINTVNVEGIGDLRTATFEGDVELLSVEFNDNDN